MFCFEKLVINLVWVWLRYDVCFGCPCEQSLFLNQLILKIYIKRTVTNCGNGYFFIASSCCVCPTAKVNNYFSPKMDCFLSEMITTYFISFYRYRAKWLPPDRKFLYPALWFYTTRKRFKLIKHPWFFNQQFVHPDILTRKPTFFRLRFLLTTSEVINHPFYFALEEQKINTFFTSS